MSELRRSVVRTGVAGVVAALLVLLGAVPADAALSISVPAAANLGAAPTGTSSLSAQLGTVTVTVTGLFATSFTATVSATDFTTGAGTANERIPTSSVRYWSGPATSCAAVAAPGQATAVQAQDLSSPRVAFSSLLLLGACSWNPTLVVDLPATAVAGTYAATITHSVA